MKFLHISDLHLGKHLHDVPLIEDQRAVLDALTAMAQENGVDAVLIAGDIYQKTSPSAEAVTLFNNFVAALAARKIKLFAISGNHDSDRRVSYFASLVKPAGIYLSDHFTGTLQTETLEDEFGPIFIHLLPFIRPTLIKDVYPDASGSSQDAIRAILEASPVDPAQRNLLIAHQFVTGAAQAGSEDASVGTLDAVDASLFDAFDYVALGHIHRPQSLGRDTLCYSGSPLKYSLAEAGDTKSAVLVELKEKGSVSVQRLPIPFLHDVREVRGHLAEVMALPYSEDYVRVTLLDEEVPPDARYSVATVFPNMIRFAISNSKTLTELDIPEAENVESRSVSDLFADFYSLQNNGTALTPRHWKILQEILSAETAGQAFDEAYDDTYDDTFDDTFDEAAGKTPVNEPNSNDGEGGSL